MTDVALRAGVSPTTVSFVLNNKADSNIPQVTRDRVIAAANELRYRPNASARALRTKTTMTIGFISDRIASGTYATGAIQGAQDAAARQNRLLLVINTGGDPAVEQRAVASFIERQVDGVVFASYATRQVHPVEEFDLMPTVLVNCFTAEPRFRCILPEEFAAARSSTQLLLENGHRDIAFINGPSSYWAAEQRRLGFESALHDCGDPRIKARQFSGDWWPESGYSVTKHLVAEEPPPTAILCGNDRMALGCYDALREEGLEVPRDVSVLGFDNQEFSAHLRPPLGSVRLPDYEMAERAVDLLSPGPSNLTPGREYIRCEVIPRASHSAARVSPHGSD